MSDSEEMNAAIERLAIDAFVRDSNWPAELWTTHLGDTQREFWRGQVAPAYEAGRASAAKVDLVITDRAELIEHIAAVSAASRYEYVNFAKHWGDLSEREQKDWVRSERRLMPTILNTVIAHLAEVAPND